MTTEINYYGALHITNSDEENETFNLRRPKTTFGKNIECDVTMWKSPYLSDRQCEINFDKQGQATCSNIGSNDIQINGVALKQHQSRVLNDNDVVTIFDHQFRFTYSKGHKRFWMMPSPKKSRPLSPSLKMNTSVLPSPTPLKIKSPMRVSPRRLAPNLGTPRRNTVEEPMTSSPFIPKPSPARRVDTKTGLATKTIRSSSVASTPQKPVKSTQSNLSIEHIGCEKLAISNTSQVPSSPFLVEPSTLGVSNLGDIFPKDPPSVKSLSPRKSRDTPRPRSNTQTSSHTGGGNFVPEFRLLPSLSVDSTVLNAATYNNPSVGASEYSPQSTPRGVPALKPSLAKPCIPRLPSVTPSAFLQELSQEDRQKLGIYEKTGNDENMYPEIPKHKSVTHTLPTKGNSSEMSLVADLNESLKGNKSALEESLILSSTCLVDPHPQEAPSVKQLLPRAPSPPVPKSPVGKVPTIAGQKRAASTPMESGRPRKRRFIQGSPPAPLVSKRTRGTPGDSERRFKKLRTQSPIKSSPLKYMPIQTVTDAKVDSEKEVDEQLVKETLESELFIKVSKSSPLGTSPRKQSSPASLPSAPVELTPVRLSPRKATTFKFSESLRSSPQKVIVEHSSMTPTRVSPRRLAKNRLFDLPTPFLCNQQNMSENVNSETVTSNTFPENGNIDYVESAVELKTSLCSSPGCPSSRAKHEDIELGASAEQPLQQCRVNSNEPPTEEHVSFAFSEDNSAGDEIVQSLLSPIPKSQVTHYSMSQPVNETNDSITGSDIFSAINDQSFVHIPGNEQKDNILEEIFENTTQHRESAEVLPEQHQSVLTHEDSFELFCNQLGEEAPAVAPSQVSNNFEEAFGMTQTAVEESGLSENENCALETLENQFQDASFSESFVEKKVFPTEMSDSAVEPSPETGQVIGPATVQQSTAENDIHESSIVNEEKPSKESPHHLDFETMQSPLNVHDSHTLKDMSLNEVPSMVQKGISTRSSKDLQEHQAAYTPSKSVQQKSIQDEPVIDTVNSPNQAVEDVNLKRSKTGGRGLHSDIVVEVATQSVVETSLITSKQDHMEESPVTDSTKISPGHNAQSPTQINVSRNVSSEAKVEKTIKRRGRKTKAKVVQDEESANENPLIERKLAGRDSPTLQLSQTASNIQSTESVDDKELQKHSNRQTSLDKPVATRAATRISKRSRDMSIQKESEPEESVTKSLRSGSRLEIANKSEDSSSLPQIKPSDVNLESKKRGRTRKGKVLYNTSDITEHTEQGTDSSQVVKSTRNRKHRVDNSAESVVAHKDIPKRELRVRRGHKLPEREVSPKSTRLQRPNTASEEELEPKPVRGLKRTVTRNNVLLDIDQNVKSSDEHSKESTSTRRNHKRGILSQQSEPGTSVAEESTQSTVRNSRRTKKDGLTTKEKEHLSTNRRGKSRKLSKKPDDSSISVVVGPKTIEGFSAKPASKRGSRKRTVELAPDIEEPVHKTRTRNQTGSSVDGTTKRTLVTAPSLRRSKRA